MLQPKKWVLDKEEKKAKSRYLYFHVLLHFLITLLILSDLKYWKIAMIIMITHYFIDTLKLYGTSNFKQKNILFFIDQLLHIIVLYLLAYFVNIAKHSLELL